jgi:hypothetical protein
MLRRIRKRSKQQRPFHMPISDDVPTRKFPVSQRFFLRGSWNGLLWRRAAGFLASGDFSEDSHKNDLIDCVDYSDSGIEERYARLRGRSAG